MKLRLCFVLGILSACAHIPYDDVTPKVYFTDSSKQTIYRDQSDQIKCSDKKFDDNICLNRSDFEDLITELLYLRSKDHDEE